MFLQNLEDAWHAYPVAVLSPAQTADRLAPVAQLVGLVVRVEGQRDGTTRIIFPDARPEGAPGTHPRDNAAPLLLGPLPWFQRMGLRFHFFSSILWCAAQRPV